ncbi:lasso peptide [Anabaena sp. 4-3]|uniref:lasso peptide n=1 Tax=Anabaena sp. 4-3 TaxID=1811979 RepID=UPI000832146E|nr:lasso peptide [Anabaena sp. 4-3]
MKTAYNAPQLTIHGNVENITNAFGQQPNVADLIYVGGSAFPASLVGLSGSGGDGVIVPKP